MEKQTASKINFQFNNPVSPSYIEPLLLKLEDDQWYHNKDLKAILLRDGLNIDGSAIVEHNAVTWGLSGIVYVRKEKRQEKFHRNYICLSSLGQYLRDVYSTNRELFFDLIHYVFYSAWKRSNDTARARFWVYVHVCDALWQDAPAQMDSAKLANRLQLEAHQEFPEYNPAFPERSVTAIYPWLVALTPPFLEKIGAKSHYRSKRRNYCTPQLFHLATDLIYAREHLNYGTSMIIGDKHIEDICKVCLLDPSKFWSIADLTAMTIREFSVQRSQWGRSIVLKSAPAWIELPDFTTNSSEEASNKIDEEEAA